MSTEGTSVDERNAIYAGTERAGTDRALNLVARRREGDCERSGWFRLERF